nr:recombination protein RecR [Desulfobacterales bacterium]
MGYYPSPLLRLIEQLSKLPGIGKKTATRLALHIFYMPHKQASALASSILEVKEKIVFCSSCFGLADTDPCNLCTSPERDHTLLCVVERPDDLVAIENSGAYNGLYHVLRGALSPLDGIGPDDLRINELLARVRQGKIKEVILATNTNVEGEATASYLAQLLQDYPVHVSRIASGIPMGGDVKYTDNVTLKHSIEKRHEFKS